MTLTEIERELTDQAKAVLTGRGNPLTGTKLNVDRKRDPRVWAELKGLGLIGAKGGLTIRGGALAERLKNAELNAFFGPE